MKDPKKKSNKPEEANRLIEIADEDLDSVSIMRGSCVVGLNTTAWGTSYRYSSPKRLAFVKNGAYYDVDQGVEPDHVIDRYDHFYDRDALTEFIHGLY